MAHSCVSPKTAVQNVLTLLIMIIYIYILRIGTDSSQLRVHMYVLKVYSYDGFSI